MKRNVAGVFVAMAIGCGLSTLASAEVFNLAPGALLHLSGTVGINIQNGLETGSGSFVQQGANGLDGALTGTIVANASGGNLVLPGGGQIDVANSGSWLPNNLPGAFGFTAHVALSGPIPNSFVDLVGNIRDLKFDLVGSTPLSGPGGNQTFSTAGIQLVTVSGFLNAEVTACANGTCDTQTIPEENLAAPPNDPLNTLQGSLITAGNIRTLTLPLSITTTDTQSDTVQGVTVSLTLTSTLENPALNPIVATATIPEPATWAAMLIGVLGLGAFSRRKLSEAIALS